MSLNFEWAAVADYKSKLAPVDGSDRMHPVADRMIWMTMFVSIGVIKADNVDEFAWRMRLIQLMDEAEDIGFMDGTKVYLTRQDVEDCIGLRTNATTRTRAQWLIESVKNRSLSPLSQKESARTVYDRHVADIVAKRERQAEKENGSD